jgi:hypothetical protein
MTKCSRIGVRRLVAVHQGSCLCGLVAYEALHLTGPYVYCHCPSCRKSSGSAYAANVSVPIEEFTITSGIEYISTFESSPGKVRHFCSKCGSPLFTKIGDNPKFIRVRLGSLDTPFTEVSTAHIFTALKADWDQIRDGLPQYSQWPDPGEIAIPGSKQSQ